MTKYNFSQIDDDWVVLNEKSWQENWQANLVKSDDAEFITEITPFLEEKLESLEIISDKMEAEIQTGLKEIYATPSKDDFVNWLRKQIWKVFAGNKFDEINRQIKKIKYLVAPIAEKAGGITNAMIERARAYPIENLIKIDKRGFALCPFHNEKHSSFFTKKNFGYCFSCGWKGDVIELLKQRDGYSFPEAVRKLQ